MRFASSMLVPWDRCCLSIRRLCLPVQVLMTTGRQGTGCARHHRLRSAYIFTMPRTVSAQHDHPHGHTRVEPRGRGGNCGADANAGRARVGRAADAALRARSWIFCRHRKSPGVQLRSNPHAMRTKTAPPSLSLRHARPLAGRATRLAFGNVFFIVAVKGSNWFGFIFVCLEALRDLGPIDCCKPPSVW